MPKLPGELYIKTDSGTEIYLNEINLGKETEIRFLAPGKDSNDIIIRTVFAQNYPGERKELVKHIAIMLLLKNIKRRDTWPRFLFKAYVSFKQTAVYRVLKLKRFF
jgi:hypothetical protein